MKTPERRHFRRSGVFIVSFEHISHLFSSASIVDFEQANLSWSWFEIGEKGKKCITRVNRHVKLRWYHIHFCNGLHHQLR